MTFFIDGHELHLSPRFLENCAAHKIIFLSFIPFTQDLLQSLDGPPFLTYEELSHHLITVNLRPQGGRDFVPML